MLAEREDNYEKLKAAEASRSELEKLLVSTKAELEQLQTTQVALNKQIAELSSELDQKTRTMVKH